MIGDEVVVAALALIEDMRDVLLRAELQIEYLHGKWKETDTGNQVLAQIRASIERADALLDQQKESKA